MDTGSTSIDITSIKARALASWEEQGSNQIIKTHEALHNALSKPAQNEVEDHLQRLGNQPDTLPSTVPESTLILDASIVPSLPPEASTATHHPRNMSNQGGLEATQELSQSFYAQYNSNSRIALTADQETQHTLREGDEGHIDITSSFVPQEEGDVPRDFSPSQSQRRLSQFPESQRFKTPATAGKKRDYNGNTRESPELPRAPVLRSAAPTPTNRMGLTQAFDATQAATSPFVHAAINLVSDRPSPNLEVEQRPATATVSSPLRPISEFRRATTEPASRYISVAQSQAEREKRALLNLLQQGDDESDDDDFGEEPSLIRKQRLRRERGERAMEQYRMLSSPTRARARGSSAIQSSPVLAAQRSSPFPPLGLHLPKDQRTSDEPAESDGEKDQVSEAETEQEEADIGVNVQRSSQTSPPLDEEDKENYGIHVRIPETVARLHRIVHTIASQIETSPSLRHSTTIAASGVRNLNSSQPIAVANSQPSQPATRSQSVRQNPKSSSASGVDFIPQSQGNVVPQLDSVVPTREPPTSQARPKDGEGLIEGAVQEDDDEIAEAFNAAPPQQSSAPAQLANTLPETDSAQFARSSQHSKSGDSAPVANTVSTGVYETALSRPAQASNRQSRLSELSSPPIVTTPPGRKRKRASAESTEPSPQQQSTQGFDPAAALDLDLDMQQFLDQSPIKPSRRQEKRRKIEKSTAEVEETMLSISRRSARSSQAKMASREQADPGNPEEPAREEPLVANPATGVPNLRALTKTRASVWDLEMSPPQKRVPTRTTPKQIPEQIPKQPPKTKGPASTAPEKVQLEKKLRTSVRAQTQIDAGPAVCYDSPSQIRSTPPGEVIAPNVVFAFFNGRTRAYYPARCLGLIESEPLRYRVQWEGYEADEVDAFGVSNLDLRTGDQVKIEQKGFPRVSHIIRGFKDQLEAPDLGKNITDIRGYKTLLVAPKQRKSLPAEISTETVREVPVSAIYLDNNMWNQMKDRTYEFTAPQESSVSLSGYATPMERASTPSTPSSRSRRQAVAQSIPEDSPLTGLFSDMAFAISYEDGARKTELVNLIREHGGKMLEQSFMELLDSDATSLRPQFVKTGFTALLADKHSRKEKYMQAIALGLPCLSGKWVEACVQSECLVDWQPYLLAAGESEELEGGIKSRLMAPMDSGRMRLAEMLHARSMMLAGAKVVVVMGRGKSEAKRKPYLFLIQALGAETVEQVPDLKTAKDLVVAEEGFDWVFVEDSNVEMAKGELLGRGKKKRAAGSCKVAGNELIVQSLIMGKLCE